MVSKVNVFCFFAYNCGLLLLFSYFFLYFSVSFILFSFLSKFFGVLSINADTTWDQMSLKNENKLLGSMDHNQQRSEHNR